MKCEVCFGELENGVCTSCGRVMKAYIPFEVLRFLLETGDSEEEIANSVRWMGLVKHIKFCSFATDLVFNIGKQHSSYEYYNNGSISVSICSDTLVIASPYLLAIGYADELKAAVDTGCGDVYLNVKTISYNLLDISETHGYVIRRLFAIMSSCASVYNTGKKYSRDKKGMIDLSFMESLCTADDKSIIWRTFPDITVGCEVDYLDLSSLVGANINLIDTCIDSRHAHRGKRRCTPLTINLSKFCPKKHIGLSEYPKGIYAQVYGLVATPDARYIYLNSLKLNNLYFLDSSTDIENYEEGIILWEGLFAEAVSPWVVDLSANDVGDPSMWIHVRNALCPETRYNSSCYYDVNTGKGVADMLQYIRDNRFGSIESFNAYGGKELQLIMKYRGERTNIISQRFIEHIREQQFV